MADFVCSVRQEAIPLTHHWQFCVGSGYAPLSLRADWQAQVQRCRRELGVRHVRFHGVLSDFMGTLIEHKQQLVHSYFNAETSYDALFSLGIAPLIELSFMPKALASGGDTVFHYEANVTPARDLGQWVALVKHFGSHLLQRYGRDLLLSTPIEVWNEPNMSSFWRGTREQYFTLYAATAEALKEVSPAFQVGGPVSAAGGWIDEFMEFIDASGAPCDFVSTHYYPTDAHANEVSGTAEQLALSDRHALRNEAIRVRRSAAGRTLYLTEWNMTSNSRDPMHDEPIAAAYLVKAAMELDGLVQGSSWCTFSDIFEENYFPSEPFHGGFGLLNLHGIAKPSYRAMQLLHELGQDRLPVAGEDPSVDCWVTRSQNALCVLFVHLELHGGAQAAECPAELAVLRLTDVPQPRRVSVRRIDCEHANARKEWVDMGMPTSLGTRELDRLHGASALLEEEQAWSWNAGEVTLRVALRANSVAAVTCVFDEPNTPLGRNVAQSTTHA